MALYNEILPEFTKHGAELLGVSVDGVWCHIAFAHDRKLRFPLLADFEPKGAVARRYGVYREADGTTERALFVIDADGIITWSYVSPVGVNPGADGIRLRLAPIRPLREERDVRSQLVISKNGEMFFAIYSTSAREIVIATSCDEGHRVSLSDSRFRAGRR